MTLLHDLLLGFHHSTSLSFGVGFVFLYKSGLDNRDFSGNHTPRQKDMSLLLSQS